MNAIPLSAAPLNTTQLSATPLSATPLKCASMNNQECKVRPKIGNVNFDEPVFFIVLVLKQVHAVVVVTISMISMQKFVFLMLLKTNVKVFSLLS